MAIVFTVRNVFLSIAIVLLSMNVLKLKRRNLLSLMKLGFVTLIVLMVVISHQQIQFFPINFQTKKCLTIQEIFPTIQLIFSERNIK